MIKGDRDIGEVGVEEKESCHVIFDLRIGGTSVYSLQAESLETVPIEATNIRQISERDVIQETYDFSDLKKPKPIKKVHVHKPGDGRMCNVDNYHFPWATTEDVPMTRKEGDLFKSKHPIYLNG